MAIYTYSQPLWDGERWEISIRSEDQVERIIRRYVARAAATKAAIRQLRRQTECDLAEPG
jgi:hypothetical protein